MHVKSLHLNNRMSNKNLKFEPCKIKFLCILIDFAENLISESKTLSVHEKFVSQKFDLLQVFAHFVTCLHVLCVSVVFRMHVLPFGCIFYISGAYFTF